MIALEVRMGAMTEPMVRPYRTLYEADYHAWTLDQAAKMRRGDYAQLDVLNLVEEIESLGRSEQRELENRMALVVMHLLKWEHQPGLRSTSWERTLHEQRKQVERLLRRMPSLRPIVGDALEAAYSDALVMFQRETGLDIARFAEVCPYTAVQVQEADWFPTE